MAELSAPLLILIATAVIGGGTALGFAISGRHPLLGPLRSFAIAAVLATAVFQLLPESVSEVGAGALAAFAAALAVPSVIGGIARRVSPRTAEGHTVWAIELGYIALLAHQLAEGLVLGTFANDAHAGHSHAALVGAIMAHTLPLTIVVVGSFVGRGSRRSALGRGLGLLLATVAGLMGSGWISDAIIGAFEPWVAAALAGFVCHVVVHEEHGSSRGGMGLRTVDLAAVAAGIALPWMLGDGGHAHDEGLRDRMLESLLELSLETAPMLVLGLAIGAGLQLLGARIPDAWLRGGSTARQAFRGMAIGAPLPICACGVLPVAKGLEHRGAGPALVVAFLLATPELGPETFTLTVRFLGWPFAIARIAAALIVAFVAGVVLARSVARARAERGEVAPDDEEGAPLPDAGDGPWWRRFVAHFDELLHHVAPWTVVGLVAAAYLEAALPAGSLAPLAKGGMDVFIVSLVAMPSYVCAASATPLAAVLIAKGLSPGAVLVGLLLGPATNVATFGTLKSTYGARATLSFVVVVILVTWGLAFGANAIGLPADVTAASLADHEHGVISWISGGLLTIAIAGQIWRIGVVRWLETLEPEAHDHAHHHHGGHGHGHDHDHDHDHDRNHDHDHDHRPHDDEPHHE
jgi:uncharacterized membrane protein YraQ (UPF0718 family)